MHGRLATLFPAIRSVTSCPLCKVAVAIHLAPALALAQTGLGNPAGGAVVLLIAGALAIVGLGMVGTSAVSLYRGGTSPGRLLLLAGGLITLSPALWFTVQFALLFLRETIARHESWDFSTSRGTAALDPKRRQSVDRSDHDSEYNFQGTIKSFIRLPGGRQWSGTAYTIYVEAMKGEVTAVYWHGKNGNTERVYQETRNILGALKLSNGGLDSWYAKIRGGELAFFSAELPATPHIRVEIRRIPTGGEHVPADKSQWYSSVSLDWNASR